MNFTLSFSGHDSFPCRQYCLKKGFDFIKANKNFNAPDAVVNLGVGKNMVSSIRYWLRAFDVLDNEDKITLLAENLLCDNGWDPFLEDEASLWLLHYLLINKGFASIFQLIFNELRIKKPEFTKEQFYSFIETGKGEFNARTLRDDFSVFTRTYLNDFSKDIEDGYSGFLSDLNLLHEKKDKSFYQGKEKTRSLYQIVNKERPEIPTHVIFYFIVSNPEYGESISFDSLYLNRNSIGRVFSLNKEGLIKHLLKISEQFQEFVFFNNDPLVKELQFKKKPKDPLTILETYYRRTN